MASRPGGLRALLANAVSAAGKSTEHGRLTDRLGTSRVLLGTVAALCVLSILTGHMTLAGAAIMLGGVSAILTIAKLGRRTEGERSAGGSSIRQSTIAPNTSPAASIWRQLVAALPEPMAIADPAGRLIAVNSAMLVLYPRLAVGAPVSNVVRHPELLDAMDDARTTGERQSVEIEDRVPVRRRLIATVTPLDAGSDPMGPAVALVIRDVSEEERLAQMRADFIANASHELRTPLASLRGFVETLQGPARNDEAARQRFLAIMATQAARMTRLIDDLLSLSRIEMRAHVPPKGTVDLNEVAAFVRQSLEPVAEAALIDVKLEVAPGDAIVRGDRDELVQVLQNLVHNAIRYGRDGGHVTVRVRDNGSIAGRPRVAVEVEDDGQGIPVEHLPRLTERFYRVSAAVSREKGGTGLGLAIVKNIVNRHRGELRIESEVGRGSTFTVLLDRIEPSQPNIVVSEHRLDMS